MSRRSGASLSGALSVGSTVFTDSLSGFFLPLQMNEKETNIGRGDARDAAGLPDGGGTDPFHFLPRFGQKPLDAVEIESRRNFAALHARETVDLGRLLAQIALIFDLHFRLLTDFLQRPGREPLIRDVARKPFDRKPLAAPQALGKRVLCFQIARLFQMR